MVKSNRSNSVSSESSVNGESEGHKRLKLVDSSMEAASSSSSSNADNKQEEQSSSDANSNNNSTKTQAAFVNKLYKMLEDPQTIDLISWSKTGDLFSVSNPTAFSKTILPQYFKHNNWQSFVRQLNMYGFHKVNDLIHSNLTNESQTWEFKHPNFRKGAIGDLQYIKRKNAKSQQQLLFQQKLKEKSEEEPLAQPIESFSDDDTNKQNNNNNNTLLSEHIIKIEDQVLGISKTCELLFNEVVNLRMIVSKQQDAMQDLVDVVATTRPNTVCVCGNIMNNNNETNRNNQDLQNAENLRLQVSKLKESRNTSEGATSNNRDSPTDSSSSSSVIPAWSPAGGVVRYDNSSSVNSTPSPHHGLSFSSTSDTKNTQKLPSFDYMQQINNDDNNTQKNGALETLKPMTTYFNDNDTFNDKNRANMCMYQRKSSSSSNSSSTSGSHNDEKGRQNSENSNQNRSSTSFMTLGKRSHLLNPILAESLKKEGKRPHKRKTKQHIKCDKVEDKCYKHDHHTGK